MTSAFPGGAEVIDGNGRFLIPGLADMHVHLEHSRIRTSSGSFLLTE